MILPATVARCPGNQQQRASPWPFPQTAADCHNCERRRQGIADYMGGNFANVEWMDPPKDAPCPEQLRPKR